MKIGLAMDSLGLGLPATLALAAELQVTGLQLHGAAGDTHVSRLKGPMRAALLRQVRERAMEICAVSADFGGYGFQIEEQNRARIEDTRRVMDMAVELSCHIVITRLGVIPEDRALRRYGALARACERLAAAAMAAGVTVAIDTGLEPSIVVRAFLDDLGIDKGLGVNFDPAAFAMVIEEEIPEAVDILRPYIVHVRIRDGIQIEPADPEALFQFMAGEPPPGFRPDAFFRETALGDGGVNYAGCLPALRRAEFSGYLALARRWGDDPRAEAATAVAFLRHQLEFLRRR